MRKPLLGLLFSAFGGLACAADVTLVTAARIHTMDARRPTAEALAYDDSGRILAVGTRAELQRRYPKAKRLDVGTAT
ncbi:hypothetical protein ABTL18_20385, partial [Acinetobacter baumannii]